MTYLLDTNVISEVQMANPDRSMIAWFATAQPDQLHLSVLTIGEIRHGIERLRRRDRQQASVFDSWVEALTSRPLLVAGELRRFRNVPWRRRRG